MSETSDLAAAQEAAWRVRMSDPGEFERLVAALPDDPVTAFLRARVHLGKGRLGDVITACRQAEQGLDEPTVWRARMLETRGNVLNDLGLEDDAQRSLAEAWSIYRDLGDLRGQASARQNIAVLDFQLPTQALELYREALADAERAGDPDVIGVVLTNIACAEADLGAPSDVVAELFDRAYDHLVDTWPAAAVDTRCSVLDLALDDGDLERAAQIAAQIPEPTTVRDPGMRGNTAAVLARLALAQGNPARAVDLLAGILAAPGLRPVDIPELRHLNARALGAAGRAEEALAEAMAAFDAAQELWAAQQANHARALDTWYRTELIRQEREREQQRADALENALRDLRMATSRIHELSIRDTVTGLHNRQYLLDHATTALGRATQDSPAELAVIDLDHFKEINDTHGHTAGDVVLRAFADALRETLPGSDIVTRYGGEEFVVVRPPRPAGLGARALHEDLARLQDVLRATRTTAPDGVAVRPVTMSAGVVRVTGGSLDAALVQADRLMYDAKTSGRDAVVVDAVVHAVVDAEPALGRDARAGGGPGEGAVRANGRDPGVTRG